MKRFILIVALLFSIVTHAQVSYVELEVPAIGTRCGMIVMRPDTLIPGKQYPMIIFHHGIGERGNGSDLALDKLRTNGSVAALELNAKKYGFILIEPQADNNWEHGETEEAYQWAKDNLYNHINWKKVYITGLSLGGGGVQRYLSINPSAHLLFAAAVINCPGPNQYFILDKNYPVIANTKVPMWYFHNSGDNVVTPAQSTLLTESKIKALGGAAQYRITLYNFTGHSWPSYNRGPGMYAVVPSEATRFNNPSVNVYQWMLLNEIGKLPVMPPIVGQAPAPVPVDTVIISKVSTDTAYILNINYAIRGGFLTIQWTNGPQTIKPVSGDAIVNVYDRVVSGKRVITVDYAVAPTVTYGPIRK